MAPDSGANAAEYVDRYKKLRLETARSAIQFYRLRERATKARRDNEHAPIVRAASVPPAARPSFQRFFRTPSRPSDRYRRDS
jgi:hypothetical protein